MKSVTLADIARKTGFSVNTVSHALHDKSDISQKTKDYIQAVAKELGYIGNAGAGALRSGKSKTVAIIVGDISNPHFSIMIKEMEAALRQKGYTAFILNTEEDEAIERQAILSAIRKNVDGILLCPVQKTEENVRFLQQTEIPFVLFGRRFSDVETHYVICDDRNGGCLAAEFLLQKGHRNILFLNGPMHISGAKERYAGILQAISTVRDANLHCAEISITNDNGDLGEILSRYAHCTAIIAFSDLVGMQVCRLLKQMGKAIPEQTSVIGFDNIASKFDLPLMLSSVSASKTKMSLEAVLALFSVMEQQAASPIQKVLPTRIVEWETTK